MSDIFISYVEEDKEAAAQIVEMLESGGYTTWSYERQGLPGHDFISQITQEIAAAKAVVLLISVQALSSHHVATELFQAYSNNKHVIPLLLGIKYDEVKRRQPNWATMLGPSAAMDIDPGTIAKVIPRISKSLKVKGIQPSVKMEPDLTLLPTSDIGPSKDIQDEENKRKGKRKILIAAGIALLLVGVIIAIAVTLSANGNSASRIVSFTDQNLEQVIRDAIGKPTGDIYQSDLVVLTDLNGSYSNIQNLRGIEYCTNLTGLGLSSNQISDLSPLSSLVNLRELGLWYNQISDISALANLNNLERLGIRYNQISDISALSGLTNLQSLGLDGNQISDISILSGLTNLTGLALAENDISDITPLSDLTNLVALWLNDNQISDVSPLSGLINVQELWLHTNQISDISPLVDNTGLASGDTIDLSGNPLNTDATSAYIPQLEARGVIVHH